MRYKIVKTFLKVKLYIGYKGGFIGFPIVGPNLRWIFDIFDFSISRLERSPGVDTQSY